MGWSRGKAIAPRQRCRSPKPCCWCAALPLQGGGMDAPGGPAGSPEPRRARLPAPRSAAAGGFPPARRGNRVCSRRGKEAPGARPSGGCLVGLCQCPGSGRGCCRSPPQPSAFPGRPAPRAAAPASPRASPGPEPGDSPAPRPPEPPAPLSGPGWAQTRSQQWACLQQHDLT